eukprot:356894-Chlamydomonas_euryale.AAC.9
MDRACALSCRTAALADFPRSLHVTNHTKWVCKCRDNATPGRKAVVACTSSTMERHCPAVAV